MILNSGIRNCAGWQLVVLRFVAEARTDLLQEESKRLQDLGHKVVCLSLPFAICSD
jgi:hypothetical protein